MTDYVKSYIGEGKSAKNFAKEYLERRSRSRNAAKQRRQYEDDLLTPAAAVNPNAGADSDFIPVANSANQASLYLSVVCLRISFSKPLGMIQRCSPEFDFSVMIF